MVKKQILILAFLYFTPGFLLGVTHFTKNLKTFDCKDRSTPHGYYMISTHSFVNPNPQKCTRRGLKAQYLLPVSILTLVGTPLIIVKAAGQLL